MEETAQKVQRLELCRLLQNNFKRSRGEKRRDNGNDVTRMNTIKWEERIRKQMTQAGDLTTNWMAETDWELLRKDNRWNYEGAIGQRWKAMM